MRGGEGVAKEDALLLSVQQNKTTTKTLLKIQKLWVVNTKAMGGFIFLLVGLCLFVLKGNQKTLCKIIPLALGR